MPLADDLANPEPHAPPTERGDAIEATALAFLSRLGVNFIPGPTMFALWSLSLQDRRRARSLVDSLHAQDGGMFRLTALVGA